MTFDELSHYFNEKFGLDGWPKTFEVDYETYANVCQFTFTYNVNRGGLITSTEYYNIIQIAIGPYRDGIMCKGVELILKDGRE